MTDWEELQEELKHVEAYDFVISQDRRMKNALVRAYLDGKWDGTYSQLMDIANGKIFIRQLGKTSLTALQLHAENSKLRAGLNKIYHICITLAVISLVVSLGWVIVHILW